MQDFSISATGHSVNYLPEYVAVWQGFFAEEELTVTAAVPSPWDRVLDDIGAGTAAAALGGIWVPSMFWGRGARYTPFAQISLRAPLAIVGREAPTAFDWAALPGKTVAMKGSNGASVGLFLKMLLREKGADPGTVDFIQDLDGAMLARLFRGGMADYLVIDAPSAMALEAEGGGRIVSLLAESGGDVPWSVYYTLGDSTPERLNTQTRFVRALARGMDWIMARPADDYRDFLAQTFPRFDPANLAVLVDSYRAHGMWTTPRIDRAAYDRWQTGIADGRLTVAPISYDVLIDTRPTAGQPG